MSALISAATEPAHPRELAGERAAVAAYRQARHLSHSPSHRRQSVPTPGFVARSLAAKVAISLGVLSFGGIAVAAETGSLPDAAQSAAHRLFGAVGVPDAADDHAEDRAGQSNGDGPELDATSPAVVGLCRAYAAGEKDVYGHGLDSTAFQALATAAGGEDKIDAFCAEVLGGSSAGPTGVPSQVPTQPEPTPSADPSASTSVPTDPPTEPEQSTTPPTPSHPTGPPSEPPTGPPTSQAGKP